MRSIDFKLGASIKGGDSKLTIRFNREDIANKIREMVGMKANPQDPCYFDKTDLSQLMTFLELAQDRLQKETDAEDHGRPSKTP